MNYFLILYFLFAIYFVVFLSANETENKDKEDAIIKQHSSPLLFIPNGMKLKFEYQYSFKGPKLVYYKGENDVGIPFFDYKGHAIPEEDFIRLVPSLRGKRGLVFSKKKFNFTDGFVLDVHFKMNGKRNGGDGMGIWYLDEKLETAGTTFGGPNKWKGLAVLIDTYDNDGNEDNPIISAIVNDGNKEFKSDKDGKDIIDHNCLRNIRNRGLPIHLKIVYAQKEVKVYVSELYEKFVTISDLCLTVKDVTLSNVGYLGLTAETGHLVDDVDVLSFETFSLSKKVKTLNDMSEADKKKFEAEFAKFLSEFEKGVKEYKKKHKDDKDFKMKQTIKERGGEERSDATLVQIWEYQTIIKEMIHQVLEEFEKIKNKGGSENFDFIKNTLINMNSELIKISSNTDTKLNKFHSNLDDMQILLAKISREIHSLTPEYQSPRESSGITLQALILVSTLQVLLTIGFLLYKDQRDATNKKFY